MISYTNSQRSGGSYPCALVVRLTLGVAVLPALALNHQLDPLPWRQAEDSKNGSLSETSFLYSPGYYKVC